MRARTRNLSLAGIGMAAAALGVMVFTASSIIRVAPGENIQTAINDAPCGSTIELDAGVTYPANLTLPKKDCSEFITIQSSRAAELPEGKRIDPVAQAALLTTLESTINAEPVIKTATAAHHYKLIGLRMRTQSTSVFVYDLVRFGEGKGEQKTADQAPHHLSLDRSWIEGNPNQDTQRGLTLNCADCNVMNSYITDIRGRGMDTQAVCGWNGTLRAQIINSYLGATGENIMFGGADPAATAWDANGKPTDGLIPRNVEIRRNTIAKQLEWRGKGYTIKNLIELKNCIDCTIDGNVLENNWGNEGQSGAAIVITVRNQDCQAPFSTIQNTSFTNNLVINSDGAFNFLGHDNEAEPTYQDAPGHPKCSDPGEFYGSVRGNAVLVANNVFDKIVGAFITINGFYSVTVENNTDLQTCTEGCNTATFYGEPSENYVHRNNVHDEKPYGLAGDEGKPMSFYAPNGIVSGNVVANPYSPWPAGNESVTALKITSDYRTPYVGKGANIDELLAAQVGAGPQPTPSPSPSVTATVTVSPSPSATATPTATSTPTPTATPTPLTVSPDGTRLPPASQIVDLNRDVWVLSGQTILKSGVDSGGRGSLVLWFEASIYAIGVDGNWWKYLGGTAWERVSGDPTNPSTPTPTPVPTGTPTPAPTATPVVTPNPSPTLLPICRSNQVVGNPPVCRCLTGMKGSSGKCK